MEQQGPDASPGGTGPDGAGSPGRVPADVPGSLPPLQAPPGWGGQQPDQQYGQQPQQYGQQPQQYGQQPQQYGQQPQQYGRSYGQQAPRPGVVPLRPLGLGELLDGTVAVVRRYPRAVFAVSSVVAVASAALQLLITLTLLLPFLRLDDQQLGTDLRAASDEIAGFVVGGAVAGVFAVFVGLLLTGLVAPAVSRGTLGQDLTAGDLWRQLRPRLAPLAGVSLLITLAVVAAPALAVLAVVALAAGSAGLAVLVGLVGVPAAVALSVHLYVRWSFAPVCTVLERAGPRTALTRSGVLVKRSWWRVLGVLLLASVVASVVSQVLQVPFLFLGQNPLDVLAGTDTSTSVFVVTAIGTVVASTIVGPFTAGVTGLLYVDRRMRAEGLDVSLAAAAASGHRDR